MKSLFCVMALSLAMLPLAACSTLTDTNAENGNRIVRTFDTNGKEMVDDTDRLLLIDRPSWLSDKPVPNQ
jgi:hypothetical protein